jgi:ring-1,2-phenylacetyl-CoA epoxidase subunit PaaE
MITYTLKVVDIRQETADTVSICFKQPGLKKIKYLPGQYLTLIFRINGRKYIRPYSLSSTPNLDSNLEITVKRIPEGIVSNHINDMVSVGDIIEVYEPTGDFVINQDILDSNTTVLLWAAGSGITPLYSIVKSLLNNFPGVKVTLLYGNRRPDTVIFKNELKNLEEIFSDSFKVWYFYSQRSEGSTRSNDIHGRISESNLSDVVQAIGQPCKSVHYICGPLELKHFVCSLLRSYDVPEEYIFSEEFELEKTEKDFEDIRTQNVEITSAGIVYNVEVIKGKSILEACLDFGLDLSYSCQTGSCSICKGEIVQGNVKQLVKKHPDLHENEYQLCCTYPVDGKVKVIV